MCGSLLLTNPEKKKENLRCKLKVKLENSKIVTAIFILFSLCKVGKKLSFLSNSVSNFCGSLDFFSLYQLKLVSTNGLASHYKRKK